eukprot:gene13485-19343_t
MQLREHLSQKTLHESTLAQLKAVAKAATAELARQKQRLDEGAQETTQSLNGAVKQSAYLKSEMERINDAIVSIQQHMEQQQALRAELSETVATTETARVGQCSGAAEQALAGSQVRAKYAEAAQRLEAAQAKVLEVQGEISNADPAELEARKRLLLAQQRFSEAMQVNNAVAEHLRSSVAQASTAPAIQAPRYAHYVEQAKKKMAESDKVLTLAQADVDHSTTVAIALATADHNTAVAMALATVDHNTTVAKALATVAQTARTGLSQGQAKVEEAEQALALAATGLSEAEAREARLGAEVAELACNKEQAALQLQHVQQTIEVLQRDLQPLTERQLAMRQRQAELAGVVSSMQAKLTTTQQESQQVQSEIDGLATQLRLKGMSLHPLIHHASVTACQLQNQLSHYSVPLVTAVSALLDSEQCTLQHKASLNSLRQQSSQARDSSPYKGAKPNCDQREGVASRHSPPPHAVAVTSPGRPPLGFVLSPKGVLTPPHMSGGAVERDTLAAPQRSAQLLATVASSEESTSPMRGVVGPKLEAVQYGLLRELPGGSTYGGDSKRPWSPPGDRSPPSHMGMVSTRQGRPVISSAFRPEPSLAPYHSSPPHQPSTFNPCVVGLNKSPILASPARRIVLSPPMLQTSISRLGRYRPKNNKHGSAARKSPIRASVMARKESVVSSSLHTGTGRGSVSPGYHPLNVMNQVSQEQKPGGRQQSGECTTLQAVTEISSGHHPRTVMNEVRQAQGSGEYKPAGRAAKGTIGSLVPSPSKLKQKVLSPHASERGAGQQQMVERVGLGQEQVVQQCALDSRTIMEHCTSVASAVLLFHRRSLKGRVLMRLAKEAEESKERLASAESRWSIWSARQCHLRSISRSISSDVNIRMLKQAWREWKNFQSRGMLAASRVQAMCRWRLRQSLQYWAAVVEARALLVRVFTRAQVAWDEYDSAMLFGNQYRDMKGAFQRWQEYSERKKGKREDKAHEQAAEACRRTRLIVAAFGALQAAVLKGDEARDLAAWVKLLLTAWKERAKHKRAKGNSLWLLRRKLRRLMRCSFKGLAACVQGHHIYHQHLQAAVFHYHMRLLRQSFCTLLLATFTRSAPVTHALYGEGGVPSPAPTYPHASPPHAWDQSPGASSVVLSLSDLGTARTVHPGGYSREQMISPSYPFTGMPPGMPHGMPPSMHPSTQRGHVPDKLQPSASVAQRPQLPNRMQYGVREGGYGGYGGIEVPLPGKAPFSGHGGYSGCGGINEPLPGEAPLGGYPYFPQPYCKPSHPAATYGAGPSSGVQVDPSGRPYQVGSRLHYQLAPSHDMGGQPQHQHASSYLKADSQCEKYPHASSSALQGVPHRSHAGLSMELPRSSYHVPSTAVGKAAHLAQSAADIAVLAAEQAVSAARRAKSASGQAYTVSSIPSLVPGRVGGAFALSGKPASQLALGACDKGIAIATRTLAAANAVKAGRGAEQRGSASYPVGDSNTALRAEPKPFRASISAPPPTSHACTLDASLRTDEELASHIPAQYADPLACALAGADPDIRMVQRLGLREREGVGYRGTVKEAGELESWSAAGRPQVTDRVDEEGEDEKEEKEPTGTTARHLLAPASNFYQASTFCAEEMRQHQPVGVPELNRAGHSPPWEVQGDHLADERPVISTKGSVKRRKNRKETRSCPESVPGGSFDRARRWGYNPTPAGKHPTACLKVRHGSRACLEKFHRGLRCPGSVHGRRRRAGQDTHTGPRLKKSFQSIWGGEAEGSQPSEPLSAPLSHYYPHATSSMHGLASSTEVRDTMRRAVMLAEVAAREASRWGEKTGPQQHSQRKGPVSYDLREAPSQALRYPHQADATISLPESHTDVLQGKPQARLRQAEIRGPVMDQVLAAAAMPAPATQCMDTRPPPDPPHVPTVRIASHNSAQRSLEKQLEAAT